MLTFIDVKGKCAIKFLMLFVNMCFTLKFQFKIESYKKTLMHQISGQFLLTSLLKDKKNWHHSLISLTIKEKVYEIRVCYYIHQEAILPIFHFFGFLIFAVKLESL